jgi:dephospho-CoA kinase
MNRLKIIGIGGTDGAGKDSLGEYLAREHGWLFLSVTDILRKEAKNRGMVLSRSTLKIISAEWRRENGLGVLIDKAIEESKNRVKQDDGLVIASLRNPGEADRVHEYGGKVIWVDADPKIRYGRVAARKRGTEDEVTFQEFLAEEKEQMNHAGDEATLNLSGVKDRADIFITNDSASLAEFKRSIGEALAGLL